MVRRLNQHDPAPAPVQPAPLHSTVVQAGLSDEQFTEIKRLLQPGYELSLHYLNLLKDQQAMAESAEASDAPHPEDETRA